MYCCALTKVTDEDLRVGENSVDNNITSKRIIMMTCEIARQLEAVTQTSYKVISDQERLVTTVPDDSLECVLHGVRYFNGGTQSQPSSGGAASLA